MSDTSPARRRGPRKGDAREAGILRTFEALLARKSVAAISIDELAVGAGISRPTFYFYFRSKEAVLSALVEELEATLVAAHTDWYAGTGTLETEAALRRNMGYIVELWKTRGPLLRLIHFGTDLPEPVLTFRDHWMQTIQRLNTERIERERALGLAPAGPPSPAALASCMIQLRNGLLAEAFAGTTPAADQDQLVEDLVAAHLRLLYGEYSTH